MKNLLSILPYRFQMWLLSSILITNDQVQILIISCLYISCLSWFRSNLEFK